MPVSVTQIASIMRAFGQKIANMEWEKAAKLQEIWFGLAAHVAAPTPPDHFDFSVVVWPEQSGITMDWLLRPEVDTDGRAKMAFGILQALAIDSGGDARKAIIAQVTAQFEKTAENSVELGVIKWDRSMDVKAFHAQRVESSAVVTDLGITPIDPLLGGLGSFNFYAVPVGTAKRAADGTVAVHVTDFVTYVMDSFDFEGLQPLGFFALPDSISKTPFDGGWPITNGTYGDWRNGAEAKGKGGDFLLVTDAKTVHTPVVFAFTEKPTISGTWRSTDANGRFSLAIKGDSAEWTETGPETGLVYKKTLPVVQQGPEWRIERPNNDLAVLRMLGFQDAALQQAILARDPHPSFLVLRLQGPILATKWSGMRVKKTPQGTFQSLVQPEDPAYPPGDYLFTRV